MCIEEAVIYTEAVLTKTTNITELRNRKQNPAPPICPIRSSGLVLQTADKVMKQMTSLGQERQDCYKPNDSSFCHVPFCSRVPTTGIFLQTFATFGHLPHRGNAALVQILTTGRFHTD